MLKHYLTTALRNFARHKVSTAISVFGLALGLVCLFGAFGGAYLFTHGDQAFAKADRIYFVQQRLSMGGTSMAMAQSSPLLADYLPAEFPEIEAIARLQGHDDIGITAEGKSIFARVTFVDSPFLRIFDLPFIAGDAEHALDRPRSVVLTTAMAQQMFGTSDVLGRGIVALGIDLTITGVIGPIPSPSHLTGSRQGIEFLVSSDVADELARLRSAPDNDWTSLSHVTYVLLPAGNALPLEALNRRLIAFGARVVPPSDSKSSFVAHPISEITGTYLTALTGGGQSGISGGVLLMIVGALIAATACVNYANLTAAQIVGRVKEIGLRRVLGAERRQLLAQYLLETGLQVAAAYAVILLILTLGSPVIASVVGYNVISYLAAQPAVWVFLLISLTLVTLVAGVYPTLAVLRITPDTATRADGGVTGRHRGARILVGVQFGAVSLLLILAIVIVQENRALEKIGLTTAHDPVVVIYNNVGDAGLSIDALRTELRQARGVKSVSGTNMEPWSLSISIATLQRTADRAAEPLNVNRRTIGDNFFETMDIKLVAGRTFSAASTEGRSDEAESGATESTTSIVIDSALATQLGWTPDEAVGKVIYAPSGPKPPHPLQIIGVVENRPLGLITFAATTNMYDYRPQNARMPVVRVDKHDIKAGVAAIDAAWARLAPTIPLKRRFMDEAFRETYEIFSRISAVVFALAAFSFCIGAAGLVGMATYAVSRLRRQIAIRKALGSTVQRALSVVLWDFSKPVVIANVVAWPLAFVAAQVYLSMFTTRIPLTPVPFVFGFLIVLAITWLAVGWQAWRAARVNPAEVLHYE